MEFMTGIQQESQLDQLTNQVYVNAKSTLSLQPRRMQHFCYDCMLHTNLMFIPALNSSSIMIMTGFIRYLRPHIFCPLIFCLA